LKQTSHCRKNAQTNSYEGDITNEQNVRKHLALLLIGVSLVVVAGCSSNANNADDIRIGVLIPTSGINAHYGNEMLQA
jgi:ABC-type branched-subunit amino acid transport system substrate-binding protein